MASLRHTFAVLSFLALSLTGCGVDPASLPAPTISPGGGTFARTQTVTITSVNKDSVIRYTVNGSPATSFSPAYKGPFQVASTSTVSAIAVISSAAYSRVATVKININLPGAAAPVITPATGSFAGPQTVTITAATPASTVYYTTNGSTPTASSTKYTAAFAVSATTTVRAITIATGYNNSAVASSIITILPKTVALPAISPAGGTFTTAQTVTITDATAGAAIYYTVDGRTPTTASTRYTAPFRLSTSSTVKAIAVATGYGNSAIAQATFKLAGALNGAVQIRKSAVVGATVRLYTAGTTGYATAPRLISPSLSTDSSGHFSLTYTCASATDQAFLLSSGGTPAGGSAATDLLTLVTALGPCGSLGTAATINEFTTVAAAYALAQFSDTYAGYAYARIGAPASNAGGIASAFLTAKVIADPVTGLPSGPQLSPASTLPLAELNSLANALSTCGGLTGSAACQPLLNATTTPGPVGSGGYSTDSFSALVNLALHPAANPAAVYALSTGGVFTPRLAAAPADWTLAVTHKGGGINKPTAIAIDGIGSVWIANYAGAVTRLSSQGAAFSPSTGYTGGGMFELNGLAIDRSGNIWVASKESAASVNSGKGAVQQLTRLGVVLSGTTGFSSGVNNPASLATDALGNVWVANGGNSTVALLSSAGAPITPTGGLAGTFNDPSAIAIDATNGAWFANQGGSTLLRVAADRTLGTAVTCCNAPAGIALDSAGNIWAANFSGDSVSEVRPSGNVASAGYTLGTGTQPQGIAVDSANHVWVANTLTGTLTQLQGETGTGTPGTLLSGTNGYGAAASLKNPQRLAIDPSGNLWVTSYGDTATNGAVMEFIGAAAPVKTPLIGLPAKP
ncbi:hypothetical protein Terro_1925 [Terriglobus roseus DSM 18391]|uniref:GH29D-like beta-sandwich domain-containing protein n=1 Tax=Terriglobus roseus (strain DSM 18391 / NRRL B-41598 / KBS 63) TaxID=926566 RepID=I3ZG46_TERRK|nr:chitobiase/beta-hexosaminidase C-terminal domain-containing protein [Terriglobus roseus]AFL88214.1 hypothetical protein Terro_1925 [Terriglobus roseus DSM 18391]